MKAISFLLFLVMLTSCEREPSIIESAESLQNGVHLSLDVIKELYPAQYLTADGVNTGVVFVNESGSELMLQTFFTEERKHKHKGEISYTTDRFDVRLFDEADAPAILINISAYGDYNMEKQAYRQIILDIMPDDHVNSSQLLLQLEGADLISMGSYSESWECYGKQFNEVHFIDAEEEVPNKAYRGVYFNTDYGLVAFRDGNGVLWRFERFL